MAINELNERQWISCIYLGCSSRCVQESKKKSRRGKYFLAAALLIRTLVLWFDFNFIFGIFQRKTNQFISRTVCFLR